ncbi:hypothetical protein B0T09DRAFT_126220 [Sordaria sp. MPI-SDFR-AT-0083]|nr:hypothetical protein B0T09DRAFT_126220 [Sordaria sp. MPI-SDFR-AT-0083]
MELLCAGLLMVPAAPSTPPRKAPESTAPPLALVALPATTQCDSFVTVRLLELCTQKVHGPDVDHAQQAKLPFSNRRRGIARAWRKAVELLEQCRHYFSLLGFRIPLILDLNPPHAPSGYLSGLQFGIPVGLCSLCHRPLLLPVGLLLPLLASAGSAFSHLPFDFSPLPCQARP